MKWMGGDIGRIRGELEAGEESDQNVIYEKMEDISFIVYLSYYILDSFLRQYVLIIVSPHSTPSNSSLPPFTFRYTTFLFLLLLTDNGKIKHNVI